MGNKQLMLSEEDYMEYQLVIMIYIWIFLQAYSDYSEETNRIIVEFSLYFRGY